MNAFGKLIDLICRFFVNLIKLICDILVFIIEKIITPILKFIDRWILYPIVTFLKWVFNGYRKLIVVVIIPIIDAIITFIVNIFKSIWYHTKTIRDATIKAVNAIGNFINMAV